MREKKIKQQEECMNDLAIIRQPPCVFDTESMYSSVIVVPTLKST